MDQKLCRNCGKPKVFYESPSGKSKYYKCYQCHAKYQREVYGRERSLKALRKYESSEKGKAMRRKANKERLDKCEEACGVRSTTSLASKKSEKLATKRSQKWTLEDELFLLSSTLTSPRLAVMLGRTIRGIQRKKDKLKETKQWTAQE